MKRSYISLFVFLAGCSLLGCKERAVEKNVFIVSLKRHFDKDFKLILKDSSEAIQFSRDFWNYFIKTHPKTSGFIFQPYSSIYSDSSQNYLSSGDTSLAFFNVDAMSIWFFKKLLSDNPADKELNDIGLGFFILPCDTTGNAVQEARIEKKLKDYQLTEEVESEYRQLCNILKGIDSSEHYIIVYKKHFINNLYSLYE